MRNTRALSASRGGMWVRMGKDVNGGPHSVKDWVCATKRAHVTARSQRSVSGTDEAIGARLTFISLTLIQRTETVPSVSADSDGSLCSQPPRQGVGTDEARLSPPSFLLG